MRNPAGGTPAGHPPTGRRRRFLELLEIYDLALAPIGEAAAARRLADPRLMVRKADRESSWLAELEALLVPADLPSSPADALRALAARDRLPRIYRWLARRASRTELGTFLAAEGGPDGGFDDLVAICQVGLSGRAKLEMGRNYWDEMGCGSLPEVHTALHERMAAALDLPRPAYQELPTEALERAALSGLLATNRWLQPEMIGALGLTELQAGPRSRLVVQAMRRTGVPPGALRFYEVHADVDPRHGRDWLAEVVAPLCSQLPGLGARIVRGAWWRWRVNAAFFARLEQEFDSGAPANRAGRAAA